MSIGWATVVPGTESPAGDGTTGALRCVIAVEGRSTTAAILKRDRLPNVIAEAFCAILLRGWNVPVPDPYLVAEATGVAFASADVSYPNLSRRLGLSALTQGTPQHQAALVLAATLASKLPTAPLVAAADEAIDNRDRNLENILWNGTQEAWIDHAFALGNGAALEDANKLCLMAVGAGIGPAMQAASVAQSLALDRAEPQKTGEALASIVDSTQYVQFVSARLSQLGMRLLARFPVPRDLLS